MSDTLHGRQPTKAQWIRLAGAAPDCMHGEAGGDVVRPWTATPSCALCRRRLPYYWRYTFADRARPEDPPPALFP